MSFLRPSPPPFDLEQWKRKPHLARIKPLAQDWAVNGFGTPSAVYLLYVVKLVVFVARRDAGDLGDHARARRRSATSATGGREPIVFQKFVVWTLLWEILGLGCGSMPLTLPLPAADRRHPLLAAARDGAAAAVAGQGAADRAAPPGRPSTSLLYAGVLASGLYLLLLGRRGRRRHRRGPARPGAIAVLLGFLGAARPARQGLVPRRAPGGLRPFLLIVFLFPTRTT